MLKVNIVSNQLVSLASRDFKKVTQYESGFKVSNQLVSLASRDSFNILNRILLFSFQSISFPSE